MIDECISPLRQRMSEDRPIRKFAPKTQHDYVQGSRTLRRSSATRPTRRTWRADAEPKRGNAAVLFPGHVRARRHRQPYPVCPSAPQAAGGALTAGGGALWYLYIEQEKLNCESQAGNHQNQCQDHKKDLHDPGGSAVQLITRLQNCKARG